MLDYLNTRKNLLNRIYMSSYVVLMISALLSVYSEFNSAGFTEPLFIKIIWILSIAGFLFSQFLLLIINGFKLNKYILPIIILLYLACCLTVAGFPVIKLRMFVLILLILNVNFVDTKKLIVNDFFIKVGSLFFVFTMFIFKIYPSKYEQSYNFTRPDGTTRATWGFNHPNTLGEFYLYFLISVIMFISRNDSIHNLSNKLKCIYSLLIFGTGFYVEFIVSDSRSSQIALLIIFFGWIIYLFKKVNCIKPLYGIFLMILMIIFSLVMDYQFLITDKQFFNLNHLFSNRLVLQNQAITKYGIHLFGNRTFKLGQPYWIDNQYIYNLLALGIIGALIFVVIFYLAFKNTFKNNNFILYVILMAIVVKGMFESTVLEYCALLPLICAFKNIKWSENVVYMNICNKVKGVLK